MMILQLISMMIYNNINDDPTIKASNYKYKSRIGLQKVNFTKSNGYKITDSADDNVKKKIKYIKKKRNFKCNVY